ncbi:amino acid adenylation domain-containing protein, partial [Seinonella peptonophila]
MSTSDVQIDEYALRKTLEQYQSIEEAVIQVQDQRVVCYLKVTKKDMFHKGEFFRFLEEQGEWKKGIEMALVIMEEFPLSADGGLDHSSLPTVEDQWLEPESFTEEMIAEIWSQWVDADLIGINQHFYELGGLNEHVEAMMHHIAETFRVDLPRHFLITIPTIQELAQYIEQELINQKKDDKAVSVIQSVDRTQDLPLSSAQQRIWFFEQYSPGTSVYHIPFSLLLQGKLDMKKWHQSIHALVEQHESLRTVFLKVGEHPVQRILNEIEIPLHQYDLSNDEHSREKALQRIEKEIEIPFDLEQGPLIRCSLYRIGDEESIFSLQVHHLICDGWSMGVFMDELFRQYKARLQDRIPNPAVLPIQYGDYAVWQQANVNSQTIKNQLEYWKKQLEDVPVLQLPTDYVRPAKQTYRGATHTIELSESLSTSLQSLSQREGVSLFMTLLTAYLLLLYRYTGQTDLAVGSPVANRNRKEIEGLIGLFINTLVFRTNIDGNPTFIDILNRVREVALQAYANQDVPFEQIVETLRPDRSLSHSPLFQVMFVLQNMSLGFHPIDGLNTELIELQQPIAKFDLTLTMRERKEGLIATFEYNKDLFTKKTIQQIGDHFQKLLAEIVEAPHRVIDSFSLLTAEEEMQLWAWNQTTTTYPRNHSIGEEFVRQVKATPHQTALIMGAEKYTYQQVNQRANQLAHFFASKGVQNGSCVGILMNRSIEQIISLIALVKLGAVYVPLRVNDPILRLQQMISGLNCQYILTDEKWMNKADQLSIPTLILDHEKETIESESDENPEQVVEADDLLYIMFTSGSTGQPKGVEVLHRNVMRLVKGTDYIPFSDEQVFLQLAPLAFDASTFEIWGSLLHGATLVIMPTEVATPQEIGDVITQYGITTLWLTTGLFNTMVEENGNALTHLERVMVGGDIASPSHVEQLLAIGDMQIINFYGPTENTTFTTYYPIPANGLGKRSIPIGKPIANTQVYVLDQQMKQVPVGLPGELFVGGDGLARGYHQQAELTKDRFIEHPELGRLYRTGDLVRFLSSGDLEFIGRRDYQVKIRGFRIELPEIETVLTAHPQVRQVLVIVDNQMDEKRIVAYLVTEEAGLDWRSILKHHLPEYMIPAMFIELEEFPLTTNGKIDRHALPAPDWQQTSQEYEVPITPIEEWLSQVWSEYLKLSQVSTIANFFTLGGHSLLATRLISRINQAFGLQLPLRSIFEAPTIRELAGQIEQELAIQQPASLPSIQSVSRDVGHHPVSYAQQRLWFFERFLDQSTLYQIPFLLRVSGALDQDRLTACYWQLVARHESMRTLFYEQDGQAFQVIQDEQFGSWTVLDLSSQPDAYEQAFIDVKQDALTPFDLTKEPLIRGKLYKLGAEDWLLFIHMHHIISDGWSLHLLLDEWLTLYEGKSELPSLEIQYVDFASWQRDWLQQESFAQQLQYWTQQLADTPVLQLPTDFPRSAEQTFSGQVQTVRWQGEWINECKALAHHAGATPYMLLLAAFQLLLSRISGQADIALGSPIANRNHPEIEGLIGFFVNTLVIRTDLSKSSTFRQLLANVRQRTLEAYAHQDVPFEKVVDELQPERHLSHSPLFQVMFSMQTTTIDLADRAGLSFTDIPLPQETSKFDLSLNIAEENNEWIVSWEYNTNLFRAETIERFNQLFQHLLQQIVNEPDRLIHEYRLQLLDDQVQLQQWNQTTVPILESNLLAPLWDRVCQHPEAEA